MKYKMGFKKQRQAARSEPRQQPQHSSRDAGTAQEAPIATEKIDRPPKRDKEVSRERSEPTREADRDLAREGVPIVRLGVKPAVLLVLVLYFF